MDNKAIDFTAEGSIALEHGLAIMWAEKFDGGDGKAKKKFTHYIEAPLREQARLYAHEDITKGSIELKHKGPVIASVHRETIVDTVEGTPTLVMLWGSEEGKGIKLPSPLDFEGSLHFVKGWLDQVDRGSEPDHDGSNGKGFRLFTNFWGHVGPFRYSIVGIQPAWAMYGK